MRNHFQINRLEGFSSKKLNNYGVPADRLHFHPNHAMVWSRLVRKRESAPGIAEWSVGGDAVIVRAIDGLNEVVGKIVSVLAIIFAGIIIYDVVLRYVFSEPTRWAFDVSKQLFGFYFILLGGYALRHNAHVRVDILTERLGRGGQRIADLLGYVIFFFPFAWVFLTRSWDFASTSWAQGEVTYGAIQMPVYPLKMAMCVAAGLLLLQGIAEVLKIILDRQEISE
ncbi:TRAP transporter small permease subunit [Roseovarius sp. THAF9]|uniref:TRAP transporter small permease subunit n=1 Tax=Roseovarius sp. THAF9 TaxID=2587847 RepID=UPI0020C7A48B|nr:TRAP transporter small permease subunit [Roseovarius sp. THAF9]